MMVVCARFSDLADSDLAAVAGRFEEDTRTGISKDQTWSCWVCEFGLPSNRMSRNSSAGNPSNPICSSGRRTDQPRRTVSCSNRSRSSFQRQAPMYCPVCGPAGIESVHDVGYMATCSIAAD